jgi:hypothetical protein
MRIRILLCSVAALAVAGCKSDLLDVSNPNAPTQGVVLNTRAGIVAVAVGLQARYADGLRDFISTSGLISDEFGAPTGALQSYKDTETGTLVNTYDPVELPWQKHYRTIKTANDLIVNAPKVGLGDSTQSGVLALAYLLKAASIGELLQQYQQVILDPSASTPTFVDRATALKDVLALLDSARTQYLAVKPGSEFNGTIIAPGFSLINTIYAFQARYQRLAGNYPAALAAANQVDTSVVSTLPFSPPSSINPIFDLSANAGYIRARDTLRLVAEAGDARVPFHIVTTGAATQGAIRPLRPFAYLASNAGAAPLPLYWPGEVELIRAEALVATGDLANAAKSVNAVRTKCGGGSVQPKACLPALPASSLTTSAQIVAEIYNQRKFELFATGLRWEDARRLGQVYAGSPIAKRCWLLYPYSERSTDSGVPADPAGDPPTTPSTCGVTPAP